MDSNTVNYAVAYSYGNTATGCFLGFLGHNNSVFIHAACCIKMQQCGQTLCHIGSRNIGHLGITQQLTHLLSRQNNILIVRQNNVLLAGTVFNSIDKLLNRRIHALTAADNLCSTHFMHNLGNAVTGCNSKHTNAMLYRLNILGSKETVFVLVTHIFYFDIMQCSPSLRHIERITWMLSMDMHFYNILYHCNNHGIAHALQGLADSLLINISILDDKFGAIRIFQIKRLALLNLYLGTRCNIQHFAILTAQACQTALEKDNQALAAGINNTSCLQCRQQLRSSCKLFLAAADSLQQHFLQANVAADSVISTLGHAAGYCQNSAFYRFGYTAVSI